MKLRPPPSLRSAFYHGLVRATSDYVLFLEKDFVADTALSERAWREQLLTAITLLDQGAAVVRLRSRKDQGCGTFRMCKDDANKPNWQGASTMARRRNWWSFYCADWKKPGAGVVADCASGSAPLFRCFTSWDSNWSLNAVMVHREARSAVRAALRARAAADVSRVCARRPPPFRTADRRRCSVKSGASAAARRVSPSTASDGASFARHAAQR